MESFASTLKATVEDEKVYRVAGDEFAVLVSRKMGFYELKHYLHTLSKQLANLKYAYLQTEIYVDCTISSSASFIDEDIFSKVNMALKYAKRKQLKYWIYEDAMNLSKEYENNLKYATKVRKAITSTTGIVPYFQPIIDNKSDKVVKFEVLSRMVDEDGVVHSPSHFIPVAKMIKLYDKITMTIIEKSLKIFESNNYDFSINLSFEDIHNPEIYDFIIQKLLWSNMGHRITFELLESEKVNDFDKVMHFFKEIKRYGAKVAIDDFGSGFSNFTYIAKMNPDFLKVDGSLIRDIDNDRNSRLIVETIIDFSGKMGIKTVAEFVHSSTILSIIKQLGIDYSQGYYIDVPSPNIIV